ncbi:MAG: hypothetical protein KatS3mg108_2596 [Isosphaeraceae bacterium]|jgi:hypothetical protein|nr:MAG: hypothetical protein KatS3mg108_2596 [Isosphaeraceae bacterium]
MDEQNRANDPSHELPQRRQSELVLERLRLTEDRRAAIDSRLADPNYVPRQVDWLDAGPDPFGMDWDWLTEPPAAEGSES